MKSKSKILLIVEGKVEEPRFLGALGSQSNGLLKIVGANYEIVPFENPIYELYEAYVNGEYDDLVAFLRAEKGLKIDAGVLSKAAFVSVYLIFDFDPQYQKYSDESIRKMMGIFNDETGLGKLYISYPMLEAVYHLQSLPDPSFDELMVDFKQVTGKQYKALVNRVTCLKKNKLTSKELGYIVMQNYNKAKKISPALSYIEILEYQINLKNERSKISVLSTFPLLIFDYNQELAMQKLQLSLKNGFVMADCGK